MDKQAMMNLLERFPIGLRARLRHVVVVILGSVAATWRRAMIRTTVVGITGSVGKTTAKELLAGILAAGASTMKTRGGVNGTLGVPRTVLRIRPWHRFAVIEAGTFAKGDIRRASGVIRPQIAVITSVFLEHYSAHRHLASVALEKQSFMECVRPGGTVWLNWDNPSIVSMQVPKGLRVRRFGSLPDYDLWAEKANSTWPDRLSFDVHYGEQSRRVTTRLVGTHWLPSALGAIGAALDCGLDLDTICDAIARVEPMRARLEPVRVSNGAIVLRDDLKSTPATIGPAFKVLGEAGSVRRWLVFAGIEDWPRSARASMTRVGRLAPPIADAAIFLGENAEVARDRAVSDGMPAGSVFHAPDVQRAVEILHEHTREGDLILIKGPLKQHLARVYYALAEDEFGAVRCWKTGCRLRLLCDVCPRLHG